MKKNNIFKIALFILFFLFIILIFNLLFNGKKIEPFQWSQQNIDNFLSLQSTINPNKHFNIPIIQNQVSDKEVGNFIKNGYWTWNSNIDYLYLDAIAKEPIINLIPGHSLQAAKKIYNENAIKKLLSWNVKEGQFILNGGINKNGDEIKCFSDNKNPSVLKKIQVNGYNLWNGYKNEKITSIDNENIPNDMNGFSFVNNPCNPCKALDDDFSCPFQLNVKGENNVSPIWKILWNLP
jgi:hypothetical protein